MKISKNKTVEKIVMKTRSRNEMKSEIQEWWKADDDVINWHLNSVEPLPT